MVGSVDLSIKFTPDATVSMRAATLHKTRKTAWVEPPKASAGGRCFQSFRFEEDCKAEFQRESIAAVDRLMAESLSAEVIDVE